MKKFLAFLLCSLVMLGTVGFVACNDSNPGSNVKPSQSSEDKEYTDNY